VSQSDSLRLHHASRCGCDNSAGQVVKNLTPRGHDSGTDGHRGADYSQTSSYGCRSVKVDVKILGYTDAVLVHEYTECDQRTPRANVDEIRKTTAMCHALSIDHISVNNELGGNLCFDNRLTGIFAVKNVDRDDLDIFSDTVGKGCFVADTICSESVACELLDVV